jgi:hypothetical protein
MTILQTVQSFISTADAETLTALEVSIKQIRDARIAGRNAALPDFLWVVSLDVPEQGHRAGILAQVSRASALELEAAGSHRLATADEIAEISVKSA